MTDRKKVIKEYEEFVDKYECFSSSDDYVLEMHKAVLALLKEQEAVEPRKENDGVPQPWTSWWYVCGDCGQEIDYHDRFCRWCGRSVKWDA